MIRFMEILRQGVEKDGRNIRLVENTYRNESAGTYLDMYGYEYSIQIKWLFFWITIKSYSYIFDAEIDNEKIDKEIDYCKFLAEEFYEHILNN